MQCQHGYAEWLAEADAQQQAARVVEAHLRRLGVKAQVQGQPGSLICSVNYLHESPASVSVLISAGHDLQALRQCVESLFEHTRYAYFEVLVVATGDEPADVRDWLQAMRSVGADQLQVVEVQAQGRAAVLNQASQHARGDYLLLLESGCALFDGQWLSALMEQAQRRKWVWWGRCCARAMAR